MGWIFSIITGFAAPWLAPLLPLWQAVTGTVGATVETLQRIKIKVSGLTTAILLLAAVAGGWWVAREARQHEAARQEEARRIERQKLNVAVRNVIAHKRGELTQAEIDRGALDREIEHLIEQIPPTTIVQTVSLPSEQVRVEVPVPGPVRTKVVVKDGGCDLPQALTTLLNKINVGTAK
jgi:hypothetical protein